MDIEKALSIKQPWAHLIATGIKDIENRTWRTNFRGRIFIHASAKPFMKPHQTWIIYTPDQHDFLHQKHDAEVLKAYYETSQIIGEVEIIDCVQNHPSIWAEKAAPGEKPIWNWVLANPVLYDKPILNVKGKLSFWEYIPKPCKHLNITRSDGLDECLDCGTKNY